MGSSRTFWIHLSVFSLTVFLPVVTLAQGTDFLPFYFVDEPSDVVVARGTPVTLECSVPANFNPAYVWFKDGVEISTRFPVTGNVRYTVNSDGSLRIQPLSNGDVTGIYNCEVTSTSNYRSVLTSKKAYVSVSRLEILSDPVDVTDVYDGDTARFECNAQGIEPLEFVWLKNGRTFDLSEERFASRYTVLPSGSLEIQGLRSGDEGRYHCQVSSPHHNGQVESEEAILSLLRGSPSSSREFQFIKVLSDVQRKVGSMVVLEVSTKVPASFTWYKDGAEISLSGSHYSQVGQGSVYIEQLQEIDTGIYQVVAESIIDGTEIESSARVVAQVPPTFLEQPQNMYVNEGEVAILPCRTYGIPPPTVEWLKEGEPIMIGRDFQLVEGEKLRINSVLQGDTAFYQCVADSEVGNAQKSMQLIVLPPDPPTGPVPSPPQRPRASGTTSRATFLTWNPPAVTNGEIEKYKILLNAEDPNARQRIIFVTGGTSKRIRDLLPDTQYTVQVVASNENGYGELSETVRFRTGEAVQVPEEPQDIEARVQSATSVLVSWLPPIDTFGDLDGYILYYAVQNGLASQEEEILVRGTSTLVDGLDPFTTYGFRVVAVNQNGPGESTDVREVQTLSAKPGAAPANFSADSTSTSTIALRWDPPATKQNGIITEYRIRYRMIGSPNSKADIKVAGSLNSYTVSELERHSGYEFKIAAVTVNGTGPYTEDWLQEFTLEFEMDEHQVPAMPADISAIGYPTHIDVRWVPPENQNIFIRGYLLGYGKNIPDIFIETMSPKTFRFVIRDVQANAMYVLRLRAFNQAGEGASIYETVTTRAGTDTPLPNLAEAFPVTATAESSSSIRLDWVDPNPQVAGENVYYTILYKMDNPLIQNGWKTTNTSDTYYVFNDLQPFSEYVFIVKIWRGSQSSDISLEARNSTLEEVPGSAPTGLRVQGFENSTSLLLFWNAPSQANGIITDYIIYYTTVSDPGVNDWTSLSLGSNQTTATVHGLDANTVYYIRVQAQNSKGLSPMSEIVSEATGEVVIISLGPYLGTPAPPVPGIGIAAFPWWLWLIALALVALILLIALLLLLCALCGCFKCCASMCPCCGEVCGAGGCFGACCQGLARCWATCCPCCCSDEEECAGFCSKLCCGACVCCGVAPEAAAGGKNGDANSISARSYKSNGPDVLMTGTEATEEDTLIARSGGEAETDFGGNRKVEVNGGMKIPRELSVYETDLDITDTHHYSRESRVHEPLIKKSDGYILGDRGFIREHHAGSAEGHGQNITYHTTNVHVAGEGNHRSVGDALGTADAYDERSLHSEARSHRNHGAVTPVTSVSTQMVTFPSSITNGPDPFTITFEETTTSHQVEKSVPLLDGTNYKTVSNHETHSKSYSTSDASKDRNLQMMLQNGLDSGPLAIDIPTSRMEPLPAITAPVYSGSTLGRTNTSSLDSHSSSSHNQAVSSSSEAYNSNKATSQFHTIDSRLRERDHEYSYGGQPYHVELPNTLPRSMPSVHTTFEEHAESRVQDFGSGRVDVRTKHTEGADGHILRSEESKESFPYYPDHDMIREPPLTMSHLDTLGNEEQDFHSTSSRFLSTNRSQTVDRSQNVGRSHTVDRTQTLDNQYGTGWSVMDFANSGDSYNYSSSASAEGMTGSASLGNLASSRGRMDYHTIDRSEGVDRLENLRRLTNKVLSASSSRLAGQNGPGLSTFSSENLDGGHSDGYESNYSEKRMYRAQSGSSGYQSAGNLLNGGTNQYSFNNNNNSRPDLAELAEGRLSSSEESSEHDTRRPRSQPRNIPDFHKRLPYSQSRDGLVKVSPSPNAHHYMNRTNSTDLYHRSANPIERSHSIANHIGRDSLSQDERNRRSDSSNRGSGQILHQDSDIRKRLMRSFSLDRLNSTKGYHSDTTLSSGGQDDASVHSAGANRPGNPNLSSFTVPGPPPHYQTGPSRVRISAPTYSPLKRTNQPGATVKVRAQPLPVVTPKAPDVTYRAAEVSPSPGSTTRTFSTEDLNAEMQHLEGLMKDLNAITASELESN
ncbi:Neogenin [Holothuria leucospilota]|uniref:Neogenin n=1 Tax=Holothuria leucospilota TaxID=206669 RepID=A0A9Q1H7G4_HOLLE|nr:Neogenin [Holothuria leucospilota]